MHIKLEGKDIDVSGGITLNELAGQHAGEYDEQIIVAKVGGVIQELYHRVNEDSSVSFCTLSDGDGARVYERGITMLLLKAVYDVANERGVLVEFTLDDGRFCRFDDGFVPDEDFLAGIDKKMREYVEADIVFRKKTIRTRDAKGLFNSLNMNSKGNLMAYRRNSRMTVYELDGYTNYFYGAMPYSTGILKYFRLEKYDDGFVFVIPKKSKPTVVPSFSPSKKLYDTMQYTNEWIGKLGVATVGDLNSAIVRGDFNELMLTQEALHEKRIGDIAEQIANSGVRIVTIAGPSSSGKTTFSYRLSTQLKTLGLVPHPIGLDDYFVNRVDTPRDAEGNYDYECIEAIDTEQFNKDLNGLLDGYKVQLPTYNFITGNREYDKPFMQIGKDDILVIEGIHGLNDKLTYSIPRDEKFKVYISALTTLNIDDHNRIPTRDGRLIRRIIRDVRTRGNTARKTISMWDNVSRGEEHNIFPFQEEADAMFNSALIYEIAAMKLYADPVLFRVPEDCDEYAEAQRLLKFMEYFLPVDPNTVPLNSVLREFIGGGILLD